MSNPQSGFITFLFTDIEGSTRLAQEYPDKLHIALDKHHSILRNAIESNNGFVFEIVGDAFCSSFESASDAINAAIEAQLNLAAEKWDVPELKVRMGIHSGEVEWNGIKYVGYITLARMNRVMSCAYGGQILISGDAFTQINDVSDTISFRDLGERRLKDLIQPVRLYQVVADKLPADFPPLKTLDARPNNLPLQLTSFVGREEELKTIKNICKDSRLLTLIGPGGVGKTRLALQAGADLIDDFANGVWFAELAQLQDGNSLAEILSGILGVKEEPGTCLIDILCSYIKDKKLLIVFDNCEHIIDSCAGFIEKLLNSSPGVKIIATSRESLKCAGEQVHIVTTLQLPEPGNISPEELTKYESIRLFMERARSVNKNFSVDNTNAGFLAEISRNLEGIPLAIELAAAKTKILSVEKLAERLNDRFKLLTGGNRTVLPKHQALKSMIDWSYELLSEPEKVLWRRLSVFSGGCALEAAEAVCSDDVLNDFEILELVNQLAEKSIISYDSNLQRYRMLEMMRQYGKEKLTVSGEENDLNSKHFDYYKKISRDNKSSFSTIDFLSFIDSEYQNIEKAMQWSLEQKEQELSLSLAINLGEYWYVKGQLSTGRKWIENILAIESPGNTILAGRAYNLAGVYNYSLGNSIKAAEYFEETLKIGQITNDKVLVTSALNAMGNINFHNSNYKEAEEFYGRTLEIENQINDKNGKINSLNHLANIYYYRGFFDKAASFYNEGYLLSKETGNEINGYYSLKGLGDIYLAKGELDKAHKTFTEAYVLGKSSGSKSIEFTCLVGSGNVELMKGDFKSAEEHYKNSLELAISINNKADIAFSFSNIAKLSIAEGDMKKASEYSEECIYSFLNLKHYREIVECLVWLAEINFLRGFAKTSVILSGKISGWHSEKGSVMQSYEKLLFDRLQSKLKNEIPEDIFNNLFEEGKTLSLDAVVNLALKEVQH